MGYAVRSNPRSQMYRYRGTPRASAQNGNIHRRFLNAPHLRHAHKAGDTVAMTHTQPAARDHFA